MRLYLFFLLLTVVLPFAHSDAHQVKSSGTISILQHADPSDDPIAGTSSVLYFSISDEAQAFTGKECDCKVYIAPYADLHHIHEVGDVFSLDTHPVEHLYGENYAIPYLFPSRGVYALVVEGSPLGSALFEPFRIEFDLRIERSVSPHMLEMMREEKGMPSWHLIVLLVTACIFMSVCAGILVRKYLRIKK